MSIKSYLVILVSVSNVDIWLINGFVYLVLFVLIDYDKKTCNLIPYLFALSTSCNTLPAYRTIGFLTYSRIYLLIVNYVHCYCRCLTRI